MNKKILFIISAIVGLLAFGYFFVGQVIATTSSAKFNNYEVVFSKDVYKPTDDVSFSIKIANKNTGHKEKDTSVSYSVDGGSYIEIASEDDTQDQYQVGVGHLTEGNHRIKVRGKVRPRFNISWFNKAYFGRTNEDILFYVDVNKDGSEWCQPWEDPSSGCKDPNDCVPTVRNPLESEVCAGEWFMQRTNCPNGGEMKKGTKPGCNNNECQVTGWDKPTSYYCAGEKFIQISNCGDQRSAIGTDTNPNCTHVPDSANAVLECSLNGYDWVLCSSKIFKVLPLDKMYIRTNKDSDKISAWTLINKDGGITPYYKVEKGFNNLSRISVKFDLDGPGIDNKKKRYDFGVKAIGLTPDYGVVRLKVINPDIIEI